MTTASVLGPASSEAASYIRQCAKYCIGGKPTYSTIAAVERRS
jgi:hypothetical protein